MYELAKGLKRQAAEYTKTVKRCVVDTCKKPAIKGEDYCSRRCASEDAKMMLTSHCDLSHFPGAFVSIDAWARLEKKIPK